MVEGGRRWEGARHEGEREGAQGFSVQRKKVAIWGMRAGDVKREGGRCEARRRAGGRTAAPGAARIRIMRATRNRETATGFHAKEEKESSEDGDARHGGAETAKPQSTRRLPATCARCVRRGDQRTQDAPVLGCVQNAKR